MLLASSSPPRPATMHARFSSHFLRRACVGFVVFALPALAAPTPNTARPPAPDVHLISYTGPISQAAIAGVKRLALAHPETTTLLIDSGGGEVAAALDLADLVHSHGWDVVVKHWCLSACAYHVFPAGRRKTVLPQAWVGVHSISGLLGTGDGTLLSMSGSALRSQQLMVDDPAYRAATRALLERRAQATPALGLSFDLENAFDDYMERRKRVLGAENVDAYGDLPGCPRILMWALNRRQLAAMGVTNLGAVWTPANAAERHALEQTPGFPPGSIFFGEAQQLGSYCRGPRIGWFARLWLYYQPAWWR